SSFGHNGRSLEICVEHFDDIPRSVNVYELGRKKRQLLLKTYLSGDENSDCFQMELPKGTSIEKLGATIRDAFGNESAIRPLNQYNQAVEDLFERRLELPDITQEENPYLEADQNIFRRPNPPEQGLVVE